MKGRIIEIVEDKENNYDVVNIVIEIQKDVLPIKPSHYRKDWKEHQDEYGNYDLEDFRIYDKTLYEYRKLRFECENLHLGNIELKQ